MKRLRDEAAARIEEVEAELLEARAQIAAKDAALLALRDHAQELEEALRLVMRDVQDIIRAAPARETE